MQNRPKLGFLISHPTQYASPVSRQLSKLEDVDLTVVYCSDQGLRSSVDRRFGVGFR